MLRERPAARSASCCSTWSCPRWTATRLSPRSRRTRPAPPAGDHDQRRRRARQRRALHPAGRHRLPAQAVQPHDPRRARASLDGRQADARPGDRARGAPGGAARDDRASEGGAQPLPVASGRGARRPPRRARHCSPATGARQRQSSATCAASRRSAIRPNRRRCWACCASTTPRWAC